MRVRCPSCKSIELDPPLDFVCRGCGTRLAWRPKSSLLFPEQMWLFTAEGSAQTLPLELERERGTARPREQPRTDPATADERAAGGSSISQAVALVTAMLAADQADPELVTAVLADQLPEDAMGLAVSAAQLCAAFIGHLDQVADGAGTAWLQQLANAVAAAEYQE